MPTFTGQRHRITFIPKKTKLVPGNDQGCYELHSEARVFTPIARDGQTLQANFTIAIGDHSKLFTGPLNCFSNNPYECGGYGSCLNCDLCERIGKFTNRTNGCPINQGWTKLRFNFCLPTIVELERIFPPGLKEAIDFNNILQCQSSNSGKKKPELWMRIELYDQDVFGDCLAGLRSWESTSCELERIKRKVVGCNMVAFHIQFTDGCGIA